jgi:hypothetical protein
VSPKAPDVKPVETIETKVDFDNAKQLKSENFPDQFSSLASKELVTTNEAASLKMSRKSAEMLGAVEIEPQAKKPRTKSKPASKKKQSARNSEEHQRNVNIKSEVDLETIFSPANVVLLCTGLSETASKKVIEFCNQSDIRIATSWQESTHILTDKIKRTGKFLCGLASGKSFVSFDWVTQCKKQKCLLDPVKFPLVDEPSEHKWNFRLKESLDKVQARGPSSILKGYRIFGTPSLSLDHAEMSAIISACGGVSIDIEFNCFIVRLQSMSCP